MKGRFNFLKHSAILGVVAIATGLVIVTTSCRVNTMALNTLSPVTMVETAAVNNIVETNKVYFLTEREWHDASVLDSEESPVRVEIIKPSEIRQEKDAPANKEIKPFPAEEAAEKTDDSEQTVKVDTVSFPEKTQKESMTEKATEKTSEVEETTVKVEDVKPSEEEQEEYSPSKESTKTSEAEETPVKAEVDEKITKVEIVKPSAKEQEEYTPPKQKDASESSNENHVQASQEVVTAVQDDLGYTKTSYGRLQISAIGLDVALYRTDNTLAARQKIVDDEDSACVYTWSNNNVVIADHNYQGFEKIKSCSLGMQTVVFGRTYTCCDIVRDAVNAGNLTFSDGTLVKDHYSGCLIMYTCNNDGTVTVVAWN